MFNPPVIIVLSLSVAALLVNLNIITFGLALILIFLPLVILKPRFYFSVFLLVRPVIDITSNFRVSTGINLAALATAFLVLNCGTLLFKKKNRMQIRNNKFLSIFNKMFLFFLLFCSLSLINSKEKLITLTDLVRLLSIIVAVNFAVVYFPGKKNLLRLFGLILGSALLPLALGLYQFIFKRGVSELGLNRIYGTFLHPNVFAQYLVLIFFAAFYILTNHKLRLLPKLCLYLLTGAVVIELLLTYTRGAWVAIFVALLPSIFIKTPLSHKIKFLFLSFMIFLAVMPILERRFSDINAKSGYQMSSWQWRLQQWEQTIDSLREHPLIGSGMGMYERAFKIMAHNDYLRISYENGILGMVLYLGLFLFILIFSLSRVFKTKVLSEINKYKIAISLILSLSVMSLVDNLARSTVILLYFFVVIVYFLGDYNKLSAKKT